MPPSDFRILFHVIFPGVENLGPVKSLRILITRPLPCFLCCVVPNYMMTRRFFSELNVDVSRSVYFVLDNSCLFDSTVQINIYLEPGAVWLILL